MLGPLCTDILEQETMARQPHTPLCGGGQLHRGMCAGCGHGVLSSFSAWKGDEEALLNWKLEGHFLHFLPSLIPTRFLLRRQVEETEWRQESSPLVSTHQEPGLTFLVPYVLGTMEKVHMPPYLPIFTATAKDEYYPYYLCFPGERRGEQK